MNAISQPELRSHLVSLSVQLIRATVLLVACALFAQGSMAQHSQRANAGPQDDQNRSPPSSKYHSVADTAGTPSAVVDSQTDTDTIVDVAAGSAPTLNINTATAAQLDDLLPGIGPEKARRIVAWRAANGPFQTIDQLLEVSGIGPKTLERIRPYLQLGNAISTSILSPVISESERRTRLAVRRIVAAANRDARF